MNESTLNLIGNLMIMLLQTKLNWGFRMILVRVAGGVGGTD